MTCPKGYAKCGNNDSYNAICYKESEYDVRSGTHCPVTGVSFDFSSSIPVTIYRTAEPPLVEIRV
jgi:hypothetical protein